MANKFAFSLKNKIFLLLILFPTAGLGAYVAIARNLFEQDKAAYVLDSSTAISEVLASRVAATFLTVQEKSRVLLGGFDPAARRFDSFAQRVLESDSRVRSISLFAIAGAATPPILVAELRGAGALSAAESGALASQAAALAALPVSGQASFQIAAPAPGRAPLGLLGIPVSLTGVPGRFLAVSVLSVGDLAEAFRNSGSYQNFLLDPSGQALLSSPGADARLAALAVPRFPKTRRDGAETLVLEDGRRLLASYARVAGADVIVVSLIRSEIAFLAVQTLLLKSLAVLIAVIALTALLSILASRRLTRALRQLHGATGRIARGDFDVRVKLRSRDEIGDLATAFNHMAARIAALMAENREKGRMENELKTARLVQETLFPAKNARLGPYEVAGSYRPANECGGDWWHHCQIQGSYYLWIGDVQGHGAPAALLTSAARCFASVLESLGQTLGERFPGGLSPGQILALLNRSMMETAKGEFTMTFLLACLDPSTGEMVIANASHPPPFSLVRAAERGAPATATRLTVEPGPALALTATASYPESCYRLQPGEYLVFHTDGVSDSPSPGGKRLGRKRMKEIFQAGASSGAGAEATLDSIQAALLEYQGDAQHEDDTTLLVCRFAPGAPLTS